MILSEGITTDYRKGIMTHATDIAAYQYRADEYCPDCIIDAYAHDCNIGTAIGLITADTTERELNNLAAYAGIDRTDEYSFDSDHFPKVVFGSQIEPIDMGYGPEPRRCGRCGGEL